MVKSICIDFLDELVNAKNNKLYSTFDILHIDFNNLIGRCIVAIHQTYIKFPLLNKFLIFDDHNLACSPFDITKELKNISTLYFFNEHLIDIMEGAKNYGIYFKFKPEKEDSFKTFKSLTPFIIKNNKIKIVKNNNKYYDYHYLMKLQKKFENVENISQGFIVSENTIVDDILLDSLSSEFDLEYNEIKKGFENYKSLINESECKLQPFTLKGISREDNSLLIVCLDHYYEMNLNRYKDNVFYIIEKLFDILERLINDFDYTSYIVTKQETKEKFYNDSDNKCDSLYIEDHLLSQICSCLFIPNNLPDGENWFLIPKGSTIDINNLLGLAINYKNKLKKDIDEYFNIIGVLYD